jgi:hypothetical protein
MALALGLWSQPAEATLELFARGSVSKNYFNSDSYIVSVSAATGLALTLFQGIRLEGRYTNATSLQNQLAITAGSVSGSLNDVMTQTAIYSVGIDFDLLGPRSEFQPFLYVGVGYLITERSYYYLDTGGSASVYLKDPVRTGVTGNLGLGFRIRIANAFAFEAEAFAYGVDIHRPNPLINVFGSVGVRIFM